MCCVVFYADRQVLSYWCWYLAVTLEYYQEEPSMVLENLKAKQLLIQYCGEKISECLKAQNIVPTLFK